MQTALQASYFPFFLGAYPDVDLLDLLIICCLGSKAKEDNVYQMWYLAASEHEIGLRGTLHLPWEPPQFPDIPSHLGRDAPYHQDLCLLQASGTV